MYDAHSLYLYDEQALALGFKDKMPAVVPALPVITLDPKNRSGVSSVFGPTVYVRPRNLAELIRRSSGEGRFPIDWMVVAGHGRELVPPGDESIGGYEGGVYKRFYLRELLALDRPAAFVRAKEQRGPLRCWFRQDATVAFSGCWTDTISRAFAEKVLRKGAGAFSIGTATRTSAQDSEFHWWPMPGERGYVGLPKTKNWREAPVWVLTEGQL